MKNVIRIISLIALVAAQTVSAQSLTVANFEGDGSDKWCDGRISRYTSGGAEVGAMLEIVDNPQIEAGYNSSAKVLRVYSVNYTGCVKLNLTNVSDKVNINGFNALRLKYRVNNAAAFGTLNARIKLNGADPAISGEWTNTAREWKTVSFAFPAAASNVSLIQIFLYYGTGWSATPVDGLEIFIDDVEVYNTVAPARLQSLKVNGGEVEFFKSETLHYNVYYPYTYNTANIPQVSFTAGSATQTVELSQAASLTGSEQERTASVTVKEGAETSVYTVTYAVVPKLDVYLCLGQSNMSGYGELLEEDRGVIDNTWLLTPEKSFAPAENPLNRFSTMANTVAKISPAYGFALGLQGRTQNQVGLIVNARNGSSIENWAKGNDSTKLYANTVARALEAKKWGDIKGIVWHQGCSNSYDPNGYKPKLQTLAANFRADLNVPDLFFVAGELGYWRQNGNGSTAFNAMIRTISSFIANADWVSADGLTYYLDATDPHFSRVSAITLGQRYAEKVIGHNYNTAVEDHKISDFKVWAEGGKVLAEKNDERLKSTDFEVYNAVGQCMKNSGLPAGVYVVKYENQTQKITVK